MKVFASLDISLKPDPAAGLVGRQVANAGFLEALWRFGDFDAYHFFPGDTHDRLHFERDYAPLWEKLGTHDRIRCFSRFALIEALQQQDYHVFHLGDCVTWYAALCHLRSRHSRTRFPVTAPIHSISYPGYQLTFLQLLLEGPEPYDAIICTSEAGRSAVAAGFSQVAQLPRLEPCRLETRPQLERIPLGVDLERFSPPTLAQRIQARSRLGLAPDQVLVLCLGRFSESDKYDLLPLLTAFERARREALEGERSFLEQSVLILGGARQGSNYPERLLEVIKSRGLHSVVRIQVDVSGEEQLRLYHAADIFVSPSDNLQETFGLTVLEAMACGLPTIVPDWDGYRDTVIHGATGLRVPTWAGGWDERLGELGPVSYERPWHLALAQGTVIEVEGLARALRRLIVRREDRLQLGQAGRKRALEFGWDRVIPQYMDLWERLNRQARADRRPPPSPSRLANPPFVLFAAHPTGRLEETVRLKLTAQGLALLREPEATPWYRELDPLFDTTVLRHLCARIRAGTCVRDAVQEVAHARDLPANAVAYQLHWLLKQGFVERETPGEIVGTSE